MGWLAWSGGDEAKAIDLNVTEHPLNLRHVQIIEAYELLGVYRVEKFIEALHWLRA